VKYDETAPATASFPNRYAVGDLHVDVERRRVTRADAELAVTGISFEFFLALVRAAPNLVSVDELMRRVWPGVVVSQETVTQRAKIVRRALDDDADRPRYLAGVRGRGYCVVAPVVALGTTAAAQGALEASPESDARAVSRARGRWYIGAALLVGLAILAFLALRLRRDGTAPVIIASSQSVAVLPFVNLTGDPTKDYLGDGVAEEIINVLTTVPGMKVPARTSSFAYKNRNVDIRRIAQDLGVRTVLEGSVREASSRLRVTVQLINAQDGLHIWSGSYDRQFTDLLKLQDDLAIAIVQALRGKLSTASSAAIVYSPPTRNIAAYDLYLQGEALMDRPSPENLERALAYFQQAVTHDPMLGRAYSGIGNARLLLYVLFAQQPVENMAAAQSAAQQALALDPNAADSHEIVAAVATVRGHWLEADAHLRTALSLSPNDSRNHMVLGNMLRALGHLRASLDEQIEARALAPASIGASVNLAASYSTLGRDSDALKALQLAVDLAVPPDPQLASVYELAALRSGRFHDAAAGAVKSLNPSNPEDARAAEVAELVYGALADPGQKEKANAARLRLYPPSGSPGPHPRVTAVVGLCLSSSYRYVLLRELDLAYDLANQCLDSMMPGSNGAGTGAGTGDNTRLWTPELRPFRRDQRFQALVTRLGYMEYWRALGPPDGCDLDGDRLTCH
jgi:TolB-like protein/DNA-binding winged helix-turn-helix (wHTH) protein